MKDFATIKDENVYLAKANMALSYDHQRMKQFIRDLLSPEMYGHAVPLEVRKRAVEVLKELEA